MPLVDDDELLVEPVIQPPVVDAEYKGVVLDSRINPLSSLLVYIEGMSWTTEYYSQILDRDSEPTPQDLGKLPPYQQYKKISGFELKVNSPLTSSQDSESLEFTVSGGATLYPSIIPNKGDMFLADVGDGRVGVFAVTTVEKKSILKNACYTVEYILVAYDDVIRIRDLQNKTVKEVVFEKDFLAHGQNPLVIESEHALLMRLGDYNDELLAMYLPEFFSIEFQTLIVPDQTKSTYDPFLVRALLTMFNTNDHPLFREINELNVMADVAFKCKTIWDALIAGSENVLPLTVSKAGVLPMRLMDRTPRLRSAYYSGIECIVYPAGPRNMPHGSGYFGLTALPFSPLQPGLMRGANDVNPATPVADPQHVYDIHEVSLSDNYIFSNAFYQKTPGCSKLELMMQDMWENKAVNLNTLDELCERAKSWSSLQRFYYVPVLLILLRVLVRSI